MPEPARVERALRRWLQQAGVASYDPYDGLTCGWPWSLARRQRFSARLWTQLVKRSPLNLRPIVGIRPQIHAKSLADLALAALLRLRLGIDPSAERTARDCLGQLQARRVSGYAGACWATPFPYVTRFIQAEAGAPNLFWTLAAAEALVTAFEVLGERQALESARSSLDFIVQDLGVVDEGEGGVWFRYFIGHEAAVYNVAALTGALMLRVARHTGEAELAALGRRAIKFVLHGQEPSGAWFYARGPRGRWVDGFHTGYVLESLLQADLLEGDGEVREALRRGREHYVRHFFTSDCVPRYLQDSTYPIEVQNCAQAIQTLAKLCWLDAEGMELLQGVVRAVTARLFRWTATQPEERGYFILAKGRWWENRLAAVRWGQAPMLVALAHLLGAEKRTPPPWEAKRAMAPRGL